MSALIPSPTRLLPTPILPAPMKKINFSPAKTSPLWAFVTKVEWLFRRVYKRNKDPRQWWLLWFTNTKNIRKGRKLASERARTALQEKPPLIPKEKTSLKLTITETMWCFFHNNAKICSIYSGLPTPANRFSGSPEAYPTYPFPPQHYHLLGPQNRCKVLLR